MTRWIGIFGWLSLAACATTNAGIADNPSAPTHGEAAAHERAPGTEPPAPPPPPAAGVPPLAADQVIRQCHLIEGHVRYCQPEPYMGKAPAPQGGSWRLCDIDHGHLGICRPPIEGSAIVDQDGVIRECDLVAGVPVNCMDPGFSGDAPVPAPESAPPPPAPAAPDSVPAP